MTLDDIVTLLVNLRLVNFVQILAVIFVVFYLIFALLILRQIQLMIKTLTSPISSIMIFLGIVHIGVVLAILIFLIGLLQ